MSSCNHSLSLATASMCSSVIVVDVFLAIAVRVLFNKAEGGVSNRVQPKAQPPPSERDEKVDGYALTTGPGGASIAQAGVGVEAPLDDGCSTGLAARDGGATTDEARAEQQLTVESAVCSPVCHMC